MDLERVIIVRYGELSLKGRNRGDFESLLRQRVWQAARQAGRPRVTRTHGRIFIEYSGDPAPIIAAVRRVFGIVSVSPASRVHADPDLIQDAAVQVLDEHLQANPSLAALPAIPFKVDTHRANKSYPLTSPELNRLIAGPLLDRFPTLKVNLSQPTLTVHCEVRDPYAYIYSEVFPGPGGLPYGSGGTAMLLISGGIDSPVAGWLAMKRGVRLEGLHFHSFPFTSERATEKVLDICRVLAGWGTGAIPVHLVSVAEIQTAIRQHCPEDLSITLLRRFMFRIAAALARRRETLALVTGESIGQVASQTLESLQTINAVTTLPVLRPLIAQDKAEITNLARHVGTYELSIQPYDDCCTLFAPRNPRTKPRIYQTERAEAALPVDELVAAALDSLKTRVVGPAAEAAGAMPAP